MTITAEQAKAELARRAAPKSGGITPGQAQAELERRRSAGSENQPGVMQQLFDVKNSGTGESYLYGNTPPPTQFEDLQRTVGDTASRGYFDKLRGPEEQVQTEAARERMPGWVETPMDIATAVGTSPYRIGSAGAGALAGAAEGAASAYGHQEGWVPGWDVLKGAAVGAATGGLGAKAGEWLGGGKAIRDAEAVAPPPNATQAANVDRIVAAKGSTREEFGALMADLENASPEVQAKVAEIVGGKSLTSRAGEMVPRTLTEGGIERTMLAALTLGPKAAAARVGAQGLKKAGESDWANKVPARSLDDLAAMAAKGELEIDPATIDRWRDAFAKAGIGYGRSP